VTLTVIEKILGFLQGMKLSLTEWLAITGLTVIGALVAALRIQGSQLHKAQVQLAGAARDARAAQDDKDTTDADIRYCTLLAAYKKAGGKI
jgi:hypothetical protein